MGKFSQYNPIISDPTITPAVTTQRYAGAIWLRNVSIHGSSLFVPSYKSDFQAFEIARSFAPYAYLTEYFADVNETVDDFSGYILLVDNSTVLVGNSSVLENPFVNIIYSNGEIQIGYKAR